MNTIQGTIHDAAKQLQESAIETPRLDAEVLLRHVLALSRTELFLHYPDPVDSSALRRFHALLDRRIAGEPVAYLTGEREFMGMPFAVSPDVLVPRPETELLVEWALDRLRELPDANVVDVGTGSGAIAVSVAALAEGAPNLTATDISPEALTIAEGNASRLLERGCRSRIEFRHGSLLVPVIEPVSLVLANLPYLTPIQIEGNPGLAAEPVLALDGGADGLDPIRELILDLPRVLVEGGGAALEIDPAQQPETERLLCDMFPGRKVHTIHDLAGLARHVVLEPNPTLAN